MDPSNIALLLNVLLRLAGETQKIVNLIAKARAEGRDVTREELLGLYDADDAKREELQAEIDARGG